MLIPTIIMAILATIALIISYQKGIHIEGIKASVNMLLQIAPLLIFAFIIAGILPMLIPQELITRWIGTESGLRGIIIGSVMGGITPGGPYVSMPIAAGFLRMGAGIGTMVAFMTGWSLMAVGRFPLEIGLMGWKFTLIRLACTFFFAPIAGIIANLLFSRVKLI